MLDWMDMLLGGLGLGLLSAGWVVWQQFAGRVDPNQCGRKPVGRCCVPKNLDSVDKPR